MISASGSRRNVGCQRNRAFGETKELVSPKYRQQANTLLLKRFACSFFPVDQDERRIDGSARFANNPHSLQNGISCGRNVINDENAFSYERFPWAQPLNELFSSVRLWFLSHEKCSYWAAFHLA